MYKRMGFFSLTEGKDPEEAWKYWVEKHAPMLREYLPGIRKYVINRVTEVVRGEPQLWGILEIWFDSREACDKAFTTERPKDDFRSFMADSRSVSVEEAVIV